ncbi:MAG: GNAT family N-acetyltransferase [Cetobacterium sp.]
MILKEELKSLWKDLFFDEDSYINWYFDNVYSEKNTEIFCEKSELKGMIFQNKYHLAVENNQFMSRYLVGIGVTPEKRGEGVMRKLLLKVLREAYNYGEELIYLTPIDKKIYERFGFTYVSTLLKYDFPFSILESFKKKCRIEKIDSKKCSDELFLKLQEFYKLYSKDFYLRVARYKEDYKKILSELFCEDGIIYVSYDLFGKINGYMLVLKSEKLVIKEFLFLNKESFESLMFVIYGYKNYYRGVEVTLPENVYLEDYFDTENEINKNIKNKVQVRILKVENVLKRLVKNLSESEEISIYIQDDIISENTGIFKLKKNEIQKVTGDFDISLNIKELAILSYGFRDYNTLKKLESFYVKNADKERILEKIFFKRVNYFNQDF